MTSAIDTANLFVLGNFQEAFNQSKRLLQQLSTEAKKKSTPICISNAETVDGDTCDLLLIYLQCIYELRVDDEIENASFLLGQFSPLSFNLGMLWIKLLLEMNRIDSATCLLLKLRDSLGLQHEELFSDTSKLNQYLEVFNYLIFEVFLNEQSYEYVIEQITSDKILTESLKQQYIKSAQIWLAENDTKMKKEVILTEAERPVKSDTKPATQRKTIISNNRSELSSLKKDQFSSFRSLRDRESSVENKLLDPTLVITTGIAVIVVASAFHFRNDVQKSVQNALPSIKASINKGFQFIFGAG